MYAVGVLIDSTPHDISRLVCLRTGGFVLIVEGPAAVAAVDIFTHHFHVALHHDRSNRPTVISLTAPTKKQSKKVSIDRSCGGSPQRDDIPGPTPAGDLNLEIIPAHVHGDGAICLHWELVLAPYPEAPGS